MILLCYRTERDFLGTLSGGKWAKEEGSFSHMDSIARELQKDGWYECDLFDVGSIKEITYMTEPAVKYLRNKSIFYFMPEDVLDSFNAFTKEVIERSDYKGNRNVFLDSSKEGDIIMSTTERKRLGVVKIISDEMVNNFESIVNFAKSIGFLGIESILMNTRKAGRYKSACLSLSKSEEGNVRITAEVH